MKIGYLVHDLDDAAVLRRVRMFEAGGAGVRLAGFRRNERLSEVIAALRPFDLGRTADAALAQRAKAVLARCAVPGRLAAALRDASVIVARNLEQLAIARRIVGKRPLVYECLDIHRSLLGTGPASRAIQAVERALLPRADLLVTSSPAFVREHFARRTGLRAPVELVENKLLCLGREPPDPIDAPSGPPWTIGWFGMLRCRRTLGELKALAARLDGRVRVLIAGKPSPAEFPDFAAELADAPHIRFVGAYTAADLPALYRQCHFAWTIDWFEEGQNSAWLLPNRLYEAQAFGVVPIVLADVEVGRWLRDAGAGLRLDGGVDDLSASLAALDRGGYCALRDAVLAIPRNRLIADEQECRALVARIGALSR